MAHSSAVVSRGLSFLQAGALLVSLAGPASAERRDSSCTEPCTVDPTTSNQTAQPHRWRTLVEIGAVLGLSAGWYWLERDRQAPDWDFPSLRDRFTGDAYINDNNTFSINYVWHSLGGTLYHVIGRSNDLGLVESSLFALGASLMWEYGIEFREKISLNDLLFTTGAGIAAGEFLHRLGRLLQQRDHGLAGDAARWSVGLLHTAHDTIDGRRGPRGPKLTHRFLASTGYAHAAAERENDGASTGTSHLYDLRFEGRLSALSDYLQPGTRRSAFRDAELTTLELQISAGAGSAGSRFLADTMILGWRSESVPDDDTQSGIGVAIGSSIAARYQDESFDTWRDRLGALHLPGVAADVVGFGRGWSARASARAHFDYGGTHAMTYSRWADANPGAVGKSILAQQGYYYAWGASAHLSAELNLEWLGIGVSGFHGRYRSQQGFDREQAALTIDQVGRNRYTDLGLWLRGRVSDRIFVEYRRNNHYRSSDLEGFGGTSTLRRRTLQLGTYF